MLRLMLSGAKLALGLAAATFFVLAGLNLFQERVSVLAGDWGGVYSDYIDSNWTNWSWGASINFSNPAPNNSGNRSIWVSLSPWGALYLHRWNSLNTSSFSHLSFAIQGQASNEQFRLLIYDSSGNVVKTLKINSYGGNPESAYYTVYKIPVGDLGTGSVGGIAIQDDTGTYQAPFFLDTIQFINETVSTATPAPTSSPVSTASPVPSASSTSSGQSGVYTTGGGKIFANGTKIILKGVNWFGAETSNLVPHGLWTRNYKDMISQMRNLGFNAVRVPFCPGTLAGQGVSGIDYSKNGDLSGLNSLQVLDKVLGELNNQGMYILLDHHRPDCQAISELWYTGSYSEDSWIRDLTTVASRYKNLSHLVGIDLKNEPHGAASWGTGNNATDWNLAAERAGKAVLAANQNILVFVEGVGQNSTCSSSIAHFWGEDLEPQKCSPIAISAIPANKLVLSPHVYGPDVYNQPYFTDPSFPSNMPNIWNTQFGFLKDSGLTLAVGEWGGKYGTGGGLPGDKVFQDAFVSYLKNKGICSSFYWSWNPDSGDTGGVLQDDWQTPWSGKVSLLNNLFTNCN